MKIILTWSPVADAPEEVLEVMVADEGDMMILESQMPVCVVCVLRLVDVILQQGFHVLH